MLWLQKKYRKSNYRVREELSQLNADFQENLQGLEVVQMFRREKRNCQNFHKTGLNYRNAVNGTKNNLIRNCFVLRICVHKTVFIDFFYVKTMFT